MKKSIFCGLILCLGMILNCCQKPLKNVNDYFPKLSFSGAKQSDGSVSLNGTITSPGAAPIENAGFCFSKSPVPVMTNNQCIASLSGNTFSANYPATYFNPDSVYYIRGWARNQYGYAYSSNILRFDSIGGYFHCIFPANYVDLGDGSHYQFFQTVTAPTQVSGGYQVVATSSTGLVMTLLFGSPLMSMTFNTTFNNTPVPPGEVYVTFNSSTGSQVLSSGSVITVVTAGPNLHEIHICALYWYDNSTNRSYYLSAGVITPT